MFESEGWVHGCHSIPGLLSARTKLCDIEFSARAYSTTENGSERPCCSTDGAGTADNSHSPVLDMMVNPILTGIFLRVLPLRTAKNLLEPPPTKSSRRHSPQESPFQRRPLRKRTRCGQKNIELKRKRERAILSCADLLLPCFR